MVSMTRGVRVVSLLVGLWLTLAGVGSAQTFRPEGPAPSQGDWTTIQSRDLPALGEGTVAGAIQAVLPDPTDPTRIFIGSTNGGIWRTTDSGATWTSLTDAAKKVSSLSIASLSFDPNDPTRNTILAGIGNLSNGGVGARANPGTGQTLIRSGPMTGLLYTTDGGTSWTTLDGGGTLKDKSIVAALAMSDTILAASADPNNLDAGGQLYRSTNRGTSFDAAVNGLPTGAVTSLVSNGAASPTLYATVSGGGLYTSTNGGQDWIKIDNANIKTADNLRVVAGSIAGSLVVASYDDAKVTGLALSKDGGATWAALKVPTPNSGQATTNLALAIDPKDPNVVYFGGAASSQDRSWTLAGYKIVLNADQTSSFTAITLGSTIDNSAPHADARIFVFDKNGKMLMGGDGGVYAMSTTGTGGVSWSGLNTSSLSVREGNAVAYDSVSKRIAIAAQDTGVAVQSTAGGVGYGAVLGADGVNAVVNDVTRKSMGEGVFYLSTQGLGQLSRWTYDSKGTLVGGQAHFFVTDKDASGGLNFESDDYKVDTDPDSQSKTATLPHTSLIVLNRIDPTRIAFGTNYVYTTQDADAASDTLTLLNRGKAGEQIGVVRALAFGAKGMPDLLVAGSWFQNPNNTFEGRLYMSNAEEGGSLQRLAGYGAKQYAPTSIVFNPLSASNFYVADSNALYRTTDMGGGFSDLTASLTGVNVMRPLSLEFITRNSVNALVVGGLRTDANAQSPIAVVEVDASGTFANWRAFGKDLPNTMVSAMSYNASADVLVVSLWGRGAWTLYDVTTNFASADKLEFGLADNDSTPDPALLTGARPLVKQGTGRLTITDAASYSGGTTVNNGTLLLAGGGTLGSTAAATTLNAGTLDLGGTTQTQNGGLTMVDGTLTNGTFQSSGVFAVQSGTISAVLAGAGSLTKTTSGTLVLSGTSTYSGATTITDGTLTVNGSIASSSGVTVAAGALLAGTGTVPATTVNGFIAPGGGTLTVNTGFTQTAGSTYEVMATAAGTSDRIQVNGPATLAGTVAALPAAGAYGRGKTYTILTAGSVTGTYSGVTSNYAFLLPTLSYDATDVFLTLTPGGFASAASTPNQAAVASVLDANVATASGDFQNVISAFALMTPAQATAAFQAISGQNYAGFSTLSMQTMQLFMNFFAQQAGSGQTTGGGGGGGRIALAEACDIACDVNERPRWSAWGGALGGLGTIAGNSNAPGQNFNIGGFAAGLDRRFDGGFLFGVTAGYSSANQYTQGMPGQGTANTFQVGAYGEYSVGSFYLDALAGYARTNSQMIRPISVAGLAPRTAIGQTGANQFFGQLEAGYRIDLGGPLAPFVTPFARLQGSTATQAGFTETGADSLNLTVAGQTTNSLRSVLGFQAGGGIDLGWREKLGLVLRLGWSHEFADTARPVNASFAGAPASPFAVYGASAPRDGAIVGLAANTAIAESTSVYLRYDAELAGGNTSHILSGGVRMTW